MLKEGKKPYFDFVNQHTSLLLIKNQVQFLFFLSRK